VVAGALGFAAVMLTTDDDGPTSNARPSVPQVPSTQSPAIGPRPTVPLFPQVPPTTTPPASPPSTSPPVTAVPDADAAALRRIVVTEPDVPSNYRVDLIPGGDQTGDQVTLDLCDGAFPSEALRTARRQVAATDDLATRWFSTEAVLYENEAAAHQALTELDEAAVDCPTFPRLTPNGQLNAITFGPAPDGSWPLVAGVTRQAYDYTNRDDLFGTEQRNAAVYLVRGRTLLALYFSNIDRALIPVRGETTLAEITNLFERRLAALPDSVVADP
jgi:hypothetical protein